MGEREEKGKRERYWDTHGVAEISQQKISFIINKMNIIAKESKIVIGLLPWGEREEHERR